jgi:shikimate kinase
MCAKSAFDIDQETRENPEKLIETMKPKKRSQQEEKRMFEQDLEHLLDQRNDLYKLANRLPWERFEVAFEGMLR